jgi:hypothetical protein
MKVWTILFAALSFAACKSKQDTAATESGNQPVTQTEAPRIEIVQDMPDDGSGDDYTIESVKVYGSEISYVVRYGGGCEPHDFKLMTTGAIMKSMPPQMSVVLHHNGNGDKCRALVTDTVSFDLSPVRPDGSGSLILRMKNYKDRIVYNY